VQGGDHDPVARQAAPHAAAVAVPRRGGGLIIIILLGGGAGGARRRVCARDGAVVRAEAVRGAGGAPQPPGVPGASAAGGGGVRLPGRTGPHRAPLRRGPLPRRPPLRVLLGLRPLLRSGGRPARARRRAAAAAGHGRGEARLVTVTQAGRTADTTSPGWRGREDCACRHYSCWGHRSKGRPPPVPYVKAAPQRRRPQGQLGKARALLAAAGQQQPLL